ncbi:transcription elongation factor GreA [Patescibacteria group bacterium]|nr:transcription elongation factor GreA [Patescibacteria group bacterium]MBU1256319.1 transcription elongation factor GreA [Patescibacteria group bacterium]MBU1457077.1 transcription elongation factor GreA [Patescibacteria group bacterium]
MTINNNKVQLTPEGFNELKNELKTLREKVLPKAINRISVARTLGDLSENYEYQSAKEDHLTLVGRIEDVTDILNRCQIIKKSTSNSTINIGHQVDVTINDSDHTFTIVGEWEADPQVKKISHKSPLGLALIGKKVGDKAEVEAPAGTIVYTIKAIK